MSMICDSFKISSFFIIAFLIVLTIQACTGDKDDPGYLKGTGSATFSIQWPDSATMKRSIIPHQSSSITNVDCETLGVVTISATLTDGNGTTLASGSWSCTAHIGTVNGIPEGSGYNIIVTAKDTNGTNLYQGTKTPITITAGQNTNIGTVSLDSVNSTSLITSINSPSGNQTIAIGQSINFQGFVSGGSAPYTFIWNFQGGTPSSSSVQSPGNVTFDNAGSYTVTFKVTDSSNQTSSSSLLITVNTIPTALVANITSPSVGVTINPGQSVNFKGSATGGKTPYTYLWAFGVGIPSSTSQNPGPTVFSSVGQYTVTFTVTDDSGTTANKSIVVTVTSQSVGTWSMKGHDRQHTGRSPFVGTQTAVQKWTFLTGGGGIVSSPAIGTDGTIYIGANDHNVYALDGTTGSPIWVFTTGDWVISSPAIGTDGTIYVGSFDHKVYALNGATGSLKWAFITGGAVFSSPAIGADGSVYIGSADYKIYALNGSTGSLKWSFTTGSDVESSPAIGSDGTVYVGSHDGNIYALDGSTGNQKWSVSMNCSGYSIPAIGSDGTVYVGGSAGNNVYAFDGATGSQKWFFPTGSWVGNGSIGVDGTFYIGSADNKVYALEGATGSQKWAFTTGGVVDGTPAISADGTIYVGSRDGKVYALDGTTGNKKWEFITGGMIDGGPSIGCDGTVYIGSGNCIVYAIGQ